MRTLILDRVNILQKLRIMLFGGLDQLCASCRSWQGRKCRWETCPRECTIVGRICSTVDLFFMNRLIGIKQVLLRQSIAHRTPLEGTPKVESFVRFTYNEASNVIMTVTGSASHMRGSEFCQRKQLCPGYRPMGLSRNSAYWKIDNGQKQRELSEFSMGSWANSVVAKRIWLLNWVCLMWVGQWAQKKTERIDRKSA